MQQESTMAAWPFQLYSLKPASHAFLLPIQLYSPLVPLNIHHSENCYYQLQHTVSSLAQYRCVHVHFCVPCLVAWLTPCRIQIYAYALACHKYCHICSCQRCSLTYIWCIVTLCAVAIQLSFKPLFLASPLYAPVLAPKPRPPRAGTYLYAYGH